MELLSKIDPPIDYHGQEFVKKLFYVLIYFGYAITLFTGVILRDLKYSLYLGIITVVLVFLICVPSWSFYRKNPLKFKKRKTD